MITVHNIDPHSITRENAAWMVTRWNEKIHDDMLCKLFETYQ